MDNEINDTLSISVKARQLLASTHHDEAWCTSAEAVIAEIGTHIATAEAEVEQTRDADIRERATTRIGQLIATRQKLERAIEAVRSKSPSLVATLKQALGLEGHDTPKAPASTPETSPTEDTTRTDPA